MFAPRQKVDIMARLNDAASAPIGHDQITASFFSNGLSVSGPPPWSSEGEASQLSAGSLLSSATKQHFITTGMAMRGQIDNLSCHHRNQSFACIVRLDLQLFSLSLSWIYQTLFKVAL